MARALDNLAVEPEPTFQRTLPRRTPGEWLIADVTAVKRSATRLHARLLQRPLSGLSEAAASLAMENLEELRTGLLSLCRTVDGLVASRRAAGEPHVA